MILFDKFYKTYGFNRHTHFTSPRILNSNNLEFPIYSELYYFKVSDGMDRITRDIPLLKTQSKIVVKTILEYGSDVEGTYIRLPFNINRFIQTLTTEDKTIRFIRPSESKITIPKQTLIVRDYSKIDKPFKYKINAFTKMWKFKNTLNRVIEDLNSENNLNKFLYLEIPDYLPTLIKLDKFAENLTLPKLKSIPNYTYLTLLELWKFFTPELKESSLFNKIKKEERININIIFSLSDRCVVCNLALLENLIKDYNKTISVEDNSLNTFHFSENMSFENYLKLSKLVDDHDYYNFVTNSDRYDNLGLESAEMLTKIVYSFKIFKKLFYLFLNKIILSTKSDGDDILALTKSSATSITKDTDDDGPIKPDKNMDKKIDEMLEQEIEAYNKKDENEDDLFGFKQEDEDEVKAEETIEVDSMDANVVLEQTEDNKKYTDVNDILNEKTKNGDTATIEKQVDVLKDNGIITRAQANKMKDIMQEQQERWGPYESLANMTIPQILDDNNDGNEDRIEKSEIADNKVIFDKSFNSNAINNLDKQYIKKNMKKDTIRTIYSLQNAGVLVESHDININRSILENTEEHIIKIRPMNGSSTVVKINLPEIQEDGTFKMSGNNYRMRKQRTEIPIRKISATTVVLNSYYGKVFVNKATSKATNYGYWAFKQLSNNPDILNIIPGEVKLVDVKVPRLYGEVCRFTKGFNYNGFKVTFDYNERLVGTSYSLKDQKIKEIEENDSVILGHDLNNPKILLIMDKNGDLYSSEVTKGRVTLDKNLRDLISPNDALAGPIEFTSIKILKENVPLAILLSYYVGLDNLLKMFKLDYKIFDLDNKKEIKNTDLKGYYKLSFRDKYLFVKRDYDVGDLIVGGLLSIKELPEINYSTFNIKEQFNIVFSILNYAVVYVTEIKMLEKMFVDPMTKTLLKQLGMPETFRGMLIKASELLVDDNYSHPNDIRGQVIKGYERINGMMYKAMVNALKDHENKSNFSNSKIVMKPYVVMDAIKNDSTTVLLDDLNPIVAIKQSDDVSYLGAGGRQQISMVKETRAMHESEIGTFSEGHKDNGQVGTTAYLSANPSIDNIRGIVKPKDEKDLQWGDILSTAGLLAPFADKDDSKRMNFINIQSAHVIPVNSMSASIIRTGYETIIPVRAGDKFCIVAEGDGKVVENNKNVVVVEYNNGEKKKYIKKQWTSKEEAGSCYLYKMITNLSVGDTVTKDDTILYNNRFFEPDLFNPKRVLYKEGDYVKVAIIETEETYQDSGAISKALSRRIGTTITKVLSIVVHATDDIFNLVDIDSKVEPNDVVFSFMDHNSNIEGGLDEKTIAILKELKSSSPKAKVKGTVKDIVINYNCSLDDMTPTLREAVEKSDKRLEINKGGKGKVNSSYSIAGKPLLEGEVEIKVYIEINESMSIGDKAIFGNQLKFTVGDVYSNKITTDETGDEIDAKFSFIAIQERIVNSPNLLGTTAMLLEKMEDHIVDLYFN